MSRLRPSVATHFTDRRRGASVGEDWSAMSQLPAVTAVAMSNLFGALIVWARVWASVKSRSIREATRRDLARLLGPGSRMVDVDRDAGMIIEIGPQNPRPEGERRCG